MNAFIVDSLFLSWTHVVGIFEGHVDEFDTHIDLNMKLEEMSMP